MTKEDVKKLSKEEQIELLDKAKEAYYNSGEEILDDSTYDYLEKLCGLENKNYIGARQGNYDVKHAFIMGSLGKIQIKEQKDGTVNWEEAANVINTYFHKSNGAKYLETTPKFDGASFSAEFKNRHGKAYLSTVATRGNGEWGTNIKHWFEPILKTSYWSKIDDAVADLCKENSNDILCIRGEVLVLQSVFSKKYTNLYVNPRAFTAGMLGIKYEDANEEKILQGNDLHFVCYDYRLVTNGNYKELSYMNPKDSTYKILQPYLNHIGELPDAKYSQVYEIHGNFSANMLKEIYYDYEDYRENESEYSLDGVVFKPECSAREYNTDRIRPLDCIAMKFMPMINATEIVDIEWNVRKTGEYFPTAIVKPILMPDGKTITRASLHNYNYIVSNNVGIGSEVRISLAGDIIPYVIEIVNCVNPEGNMNLPEDGHIVSDPNSGSMHYMKDFQENEEQKNHFISSCTVLNINTIGDAAASDLFDNLYDEIPDLENVIQLMNEDSYKLIYDTMGSGKTIINIINNLKLYASKITLVDIIKSFCFKMCGQRASELCARIMSGLSYSTASMPEVSYSWALNKNSQNYYKVKKAMEMLDVEFLEEDETDMDKIPIIMTGSPEDCTTFSTKEQWLQAHPQYVNTSSWKECKILFTNDLDSNTGKMQKAKKLGVEIRQYDDNGKTTKESKKPFDFENESMSLF